VCSGEAEVGGCRLRWVAEAGAEVRWLCVCSGEAEVGGCRPVCPAPLLISPPLESWSTLGGMQEMCESGKGNDLPGLTMQG